MNFAKYYNYYSSSIDFDSFQEVGHFFAQIMLYLRMKAGTQFREDDEPLKFFLNPQKEIEKENAIIFYFDKDIDIKKPTYDKYLSAFLNQSNPNYKSAAFIDKAKKQSIIVFEKRPENMLLFEAVYFVIPQIIPWKFDFKKIITQEEIPLFIEMIKTGTMARQIELLAIELGLQEKFIIEKLLQFGETMVNDKLQRIEQEIKDREIRIDTYMKSIGEITAEIRERKLRKTAIELNRIEFENPINEMIHFIEQTPEQIRLDDINSISFRFSIKSQMEHFSIEDYKSYVLDNHGNSYFYTNAPAKHDMDSLRALYRAIFETQKIKIYFRSGFSFNLHSGDLSEHETSFTDNFSMNHPHLNCGYFCCGFNYHRAEYMSRQDYVGIMNCIIYVAKQFSIADSAIGRLFISQLFDDVLKCCEMPNGEFLNGNEAIDYIKQHPEEF